MTIILYKSICDIIPVLSYELIKIIKYQIPGPSDRELCHLGGSREYPFKRTKKKFTMKF